MGQHIEAFLDPEVGEDGSRQCVSASVLGLNMDAPTMVQLQRNSPNESWGFRLSGGRDFSMQLQVKKVDPNTPASIASLNQGDAIVAIGNTSATPLSHMQAHQLIRSAGNVLQLSILKGHFKALTNVKPKGPVKFSPWRQS